MVVKRNKQWNKEKKKKKGRQDGEIIGHLRKPKEGRQHKISILKEAKSRLRGTEMVPRSPFCKYQFRNL